MIWWNPCKFSGTRMNFNQSKRVCWKVFVKMCVASILRRIYIACREKDYNKTRFEYHHERVYKKLKIKICYCNIYGNNVVINNNLKWIIWFLKTCTPFQHLEIE